MALLLCLQEDVDDEFVTLDAYPRFTLPRLYEAIVLRPQKVYAEKLFSEQFTAVARWIKRLNTIYIVSTFGCEMCRNREKWKYCLDELSDRILLNGSMLALENIYLEPFQPSNDE